MPSRRKQLRARTFWDHVTKTASGRFFNGQKMKLLDSRGGPLRKTVTAHAVIFVSDDGETNWTPLKPYNIHEALKDPDVLGYMMAGEIIQIGENGQFYYAEHYDPERLH